MKALLLFLTCLVASPCPSCSHVPPPVVTCVADPSLLNEVSDDLEYAAAEHKLEELAAQVGLCVVNAEVQSLLGPPAKQNQPFRRLSPVAVQNARAWLSKHATLDAGTSH